MGNSKRKIFRCNETWTKETVWRKLAAFTNIGAIRNILNRKDKNEQDIVFSLKSAQGFLMDVDRNLSSALINSYYGCFWTLATLIMIKNEDISIKDISNASRDGHGLNLDYKHSNDPLAWYVYIRQIGFMNLLVRKPPFLADIERISLPKGLSKKHIEDKKNYKYGYQIEELMCRMPDLSWQYELITNKPSKCILQNKRWIRVSKFASVEFIRENFPHIKIGNKLQKESDSSADFDHYDVESSATSDLQGISYFSPVYKYNLISKLDKPLDNDLLWYTMFAYCWSIIARYSPDYVEKMEYGDLTHWKSFLEEFNWYVRVRFPTACLNYMTGSEWLFSPPVFLS